MISSTINNMTIRVPVYAIKVQSKFVKNADTYISFRMKAMNPKAYKHAVALVAQHQNNLRTVVINNVSEDAFFVMENYAKQIENVLTVHHLIDKKSMRLVTYKDDVMEVRRQVRRDFPSWLNNLDPSTFCSCGQPPTIVTTHHDELSEESASDLSLSINSLLSLDIQDFSLFQEPKYNPDTQEKTSLDITMSQTDEKIANQQEILDTQGQRIEEVLKMIKEMKDETKSKIYKLIQIVTELTTHQVQNDSKKEENTKGSGSMNKRRP
jgi:hypothetical protein